MKRRISIVIGIVVFILLIIGIDLWYIQEDQGHSVNVYTVKKEDMEKKVFVVGKLEAINSMAISTKNPGEVVELNVSVGDEVLKGQQLLKFNDKALSNELDLASKELAVQLGKSDKHKINIEETESQVNASKVRLERYQRLYAIGATSKSVLEEYELALEQNQRTHQAAKKELELNNIQVSQAKINIKDKREKLSNCIIKAPMDGEIFSLNVKHGEYIEEGFLLGVIGHRNKLKLVAEVNEIDSGVLAIGCEAILNIPAVQKENFYGKVTKIAPIAYEKVQDNITQNVVEVTISIDKPMNLKPGYSADVTIIANSKPQAIVIPYEALVNVEEKYENHVWVIKEGKTFKIPVILGLRNELNIEVLNGLSEKDIVIVNPDKGLSEGKTVKIRTVENDIF